MPKQRLISIVDDDQPFRDSMRKLVTLLGYTVEAFASAADFLGSPLLSETACLVTDVQMPELRALNSIDASSMQATRSRRSWLRHIRTMPLATAPGRMACFVTSPSRWMTTISSGAFVRLSNREAARIDPWVYSAAGRVNRNTAPRGSLWSTHKRPPCATMMERQIASPIPSPLVFVV